MRLATIGEVVWYVTGRFYAIAASPGEVRRSVDAGYFLHLQGIRHPLFDGAVSERHARFTFAAEPFRAPTVSNGGMGIGLDARGVFRLFLRAEVGASFDDPASFAAGCCIGTFERVAIVVTANVDVSASATALFNVFTARLVSSRPFDFGGRRYDLRDLVGPAITQWGIAAPEPLTPPAGYDSVVPFVGSAIRAG